MKSIWKKFSSLKLSRVYAATLALFFSFYANHALAVDWPWTKLLGEIQDELTGPLPTTLGILGIVIALVGLFTGQAGDGVRRILVIILALSTVIFAPTLVSLIVESAGG